MRPLAERPGQVRERPLPRAGERDRRALRVQRPAIAPPMPPDAPVMSARLPVRSNMAVPLAPDQARIAPGGSARKGGGEAGDILRRPDLIGGDVARDAPHHARERLARADLDDPGDALLGHPGDRFAPAHPRGDLLDQQAADGLRVADRLGRDIGDERHGGGADLGLASASAIASAAGCISAQWKGAETGSSIVRLAPCSRARIIARSTAALWPEITTCWGSLSFAASQTSPSAASEAIDHGLS